jgi:hypothetical protein
MARSENSRVFENELLPDASAGRGAFFIAGYCTVRELVSGARTYSSGADAAIRMFGRCRGFRCCDELERVIGRRGFGD